MKKYQSKIVKLFAIAVIAMIPLCAETVHEQVDREDPQEEIVAKSIDPTYTTHQRSIHRFRGFAPGGEIELEDGSCWSVRLDQRQTIMSWLPHYDDLVIVPAGWWARNRYDMQFSIYNIRTGQTVDANVTMTPYPNGEWTLYIRQVVPFSDYPYLELSDGSIWILHNSERHIWGENLYGVLKWRPGDLIVIGNNKGLGSYFNPNILINVSDGALWITSKCDK